MPAADPVLSGLLSYSCSPSLAGNVKIDLTEMDPDFYFANGHKWLYSARGSAFLYVKPQYQDANEPTVVDSIGDAFVDRFVYTGTRDYVPFVTINDAIKFRNKVGFGSLCTIRLKWNVEPRVLCAQCMRCIGQVLGGEDAIMAYNHQLATDGGAYLAKLWNTAVMAPPEMMQMSITSVALPIKEKNSTECNAAAAALKNMGMVVGGPSDAVADAGVPCFVRLWYVS